MSTEAPDANQYSDVEHPWRDEDILRELYQEEKLTASDIAGRLGTTQPTVCRWLKKYSVSIERSRGTRPEDNGLPDNQPWHDEDTLERLYHGEGLTLSDVGDRLGCSHCTVLHWMREHEIPRRDPPAGDRHHSWKGGIYDDGYGPEWPQTREDTLERDGHACRACGMTREEHIEEYDHGLHVHHIVPLRKFDGPEEANRLGNLVTACISCHNKYEGLPVFPNSP